ncbi:uncharacterized protein EAE97_009608 [Botrytis byssoidea]|uniref:Uncharacterized protein n=1 Tax=Botrytis byssoidea TaxID=139641 RepID=A0A9P5LW24_9HELO|nr:uncharacterized protein EAE97_009608 [Botrytis byssoidea]KAF7930011.1 hypothetical protein EAE97_009608 [Botrytis byssoidea]
MDSEKVGKSSKGISFDSSTKVEKEEKREPVKAGTKRGAPITKHVERAPTARFTDDAPKGKKIKR